MAGKKTASKVSKRAELNINTTSNNNKRNNRKAKSAVKKLSIKTLCVTLCLFLLAGVAGVGVSFFLTRNDCFEIIGNDEITLMLTERYVDEGVNVVAFGVDDRDKVSIETDMKQDDKGYYAEEEGTYYIIYTVDNLKYGKLFKVQKIRLITFVEPTEESEIIPNDSVEVANV